MSQSCLPKGHLDSYFAKPECGIFTLHFYIRRVQLTLLCITTSLQDSCDLLLVISMSSQLVQYVIVRGDLLRLLSWPTGAVIAQACHASTAVLWTYRNDPHTIEYTSELDRMHKVVLEVRHATNVAFCSQMMVILFNLHYSQGRSSVR